MNLIVREQVSVMTKSKNPFRKPAAFLTVVVGIAILVAVGSYFLIGVIFR